MTDTTVPVYRDPNAPVDSRVSDLRARMTLREKVGQLNQRMYGWNAYRRTPDSPDGFELTDALRAETDRFAGLGALYGLFRADAWSGVDHTNGPGAQDSAALAELVQRHVIASSRLGIPALFVEEVPHGHMALDGTVLPVNLAVGATWDPDLYERAAAHAAAELRARGGHLALVSALDIARDPRWGRTEECFGEDPHLAARLTEALVRGCRASPATASLPTRPPSSSGTSPARAPRSAAATPPSPNSASVNSTRSTSPPPAPESAQVPPPSCPPTTRSTACPAPAATPC